MVDSGGESSQDRLYEIRQRKRQYNKDIIVINHQHHLHHHSPLTVLVEHVEDKVDDVIRELNTRGGAARTPELI